jgi:hypothetical protein
MNFLSYFLLAVIFERIKASFKLNILNDELNGLEYCKIMKINNFTEEKAYFGAT